MGQGLCLRSRSGKGKCVCVYMCGLSASVVRSFVLAASRVTLCRLSPHADRPHLHSCLGSARGWSSDVVGQRAG
jgi:hypothetical protein